MVRGWTFLLFLSLLCGCGTRAVRMAQPEDPKGRYQHQIAAAQALLEQKESWAARTEWEVQQTPGGWKVIAWRVEHPDRYLPWGYSEIELDRRLVTVGYHRKG